MAAASVAVGHHLDRRGRASPPTGGAGRRAHRQEPALRVARRGLWAGGCLAARHQRGGRARADDRADTLVWFPASGLPVHAATARTPWPSPVAVTGAACPDR